MFPPLPLPGVPFVSLCPAFLRECLILFPFRSISTCSVLSSAGHPQQGPFSRAAVPLNPPSQSNAATAAVASKDPDSKQPSTINPHPLPLLRALLVGVDDSSSSSSSSTDLFLFCPFEGEGGVGVGVGGEGEGGGGGDPAPPAGEDLGV